MSLGGEKKLWGGKIVCFEVTLYTVRSVIDYYVSYGSTVNLCSIDLSKAFDTRKLCYRKDDRAMRPIHGCPENFRDSLTTPTATIPNSFHELLFESTL